MALKEDLDVENICRVCLLNDNDMKLIFEYEKTPTIAQMLTDLTRYKVQRFDNLPHLICEQCLKVLLVAYELKQKCEQSYRKLIKLLDVEKLVMDLSVKNGLEKCTQTDDSSVYPCERCEEKFFTYDSLRSHRKNYHKGSAIICRFCSRSFDRIGYLKTHIAVFHPESGYKSHNQCRICKRQFTRRQHMRRHMAQIHKIVSIKEDKVIVFEEAESLILYKAEEEEQPMEVDHIKEYADESVIKKESVRDSLALEEELDKDGITSSLSDNDDEEKLLEELINNDISKQHLEDVLNESPIEIKLSDEKEPENDSCKAPPVLENSLQTATKRSRGRPPKSTFSCKYCDKLFDDEPKLKTHVVDEHQKAQNYLCKLCADTFANEPDLQTHLKSSHNSELLATTSATHCKLLRVTKPTHSTLHPCPKCPRTFSTKNSLHKHLEKHEKAKSYLCKECSLKFATRDELKEHAKVQGHDKPLLCPECGLRCKSSNSLMVHMRRHNGEKPFKCKFCSKGFPRMDDLRLHEKYHTGERTHFCETCGKGFQRKYSLTIHTRTHTGEKPFKCPHCPQAFAQGNDLKAHIRRHTGERFRCEICNAAFLQGYQLRQHKLQEHGIHEVPPTQRLKKFTSPEEQEKQIQENKQNETMT